ncbi:MAG: cellulase family glycosylhydrolase, partial [Oscillospiraceae bacterium]|nr:cellulase family glycosylhydrolase [Oscillospiraceae bacterium]
KNFTEETLLDDYWRDSWAYINEQDIAPLLIGEWGGKLPKGADLESYVDADASAMDDLDKNVKWMILLRNYMINHHINHTFWCLNPNSGDTEGLLSNDFKTWDEEKYGLMEPALWQTASSGKYIGLDHQVPLGGEGSTTGISVGDYYKSYAASEGSNLDASGKTDPKQPVTAATDETTESTEATEQTEGTPGPTIGTTVTTPKSDVTPGGEPAYGDVDENGKVELLDVILLNKSLLGIEQLSEQANKNADVDVNQKIDSSDSLYILKYTVSLVDSFPIR